MFTGEKSDIQQSPWKEEGNSLEMTDVQGAFRYRRLLSLIILNSAKTVFSHSPSPAPKKERKLFCKELRFTDSKRGVLRVNPH